jgi:quinol monooxygenase YgiN
MIRVHPGKMPELMPAAKAVIAATNAKEEGCLLYDMHQSITEPDVIRVVERWKSREDLAKHFEMDHMKAWRAAGAPLIAERKVEIITPADVEIR